MHRMRLHRCMLMLASLIGAFAAAIRIDVCTGAACVRNGGRQLLDVTEALSSAGVVHPVGCRSVCPSRDVVCRVDGSTEKVSSSQPSEAIESASRLLTLAGAKLVPSMVAAVTAKAEAEVALQEGRLEDAAEKFTAALSAQPGPYEPAQAAVPPEPLAWEGTTWVVEDERGAFGSELVFEESVTSFEFGVSDEGTLTLTDCTLSESDDEASLTGYFEGDEGYGALELSMASDGRSFSGMLTWDEDGSIETWRGRRVSEGSYGEAAPTNVRWLHESLLGRSGARLSLGRSAEALEDARAATRLCGRVSDGWHALTAAAEACGDEAAVEDAQAVLPLLGETL